MLAKFFYFGQKDDLFWPERELDITYLQGKLTLAGQNMLFVQNNLARFGRIRFWPKSTF
ncbi:hypothetical protein M0Q03_03855 [bacterium]|jgi:hypothetical protein|nr:hypothetical protein [bacterium]